MKKILIMGLPGSGKTTLAKEVVKSLKADWLNADKIRGKYKDWDFSREGILRQVKRMTKLANKSKKNFVVADFICPYEEQFKIFKPHYIVWMDTIIKSRYPHINKIFKKPKKFDVRVTSKDCKLWKIPIIDHVKKNRWDNQKETGQMLGRFQPFHIGHKLLFFEILKKKGQVIVMVKDMHGVGDNPFSFTQIKKEINKQLFPFQKRYKIILAPNISEIFYGRKVGYKINKINLPKKIQKISATNIRKYLRKKKILKR